MLTRIPARAPVRRLVATAGAFTVIVALAGCGGDDTGGSASFCDDVKEVLESEAAGGEDAGVAQFQAAVDRLKSIDPPAEISDDWKTVFESYEAESPADVDVDAVNKAGERLTTYMKDECGIEQ